MKKTVDIIGVQLISITEGKKLGVVKSLVIDANTGTVTALAIEDNKWYLGAKFLPISEVSSIGEYAVTTTSSDTLLSITEASEMEPLLEADIKVIGTKVLTTSGKIQGTVTELFIDESGKIVECEIEDNNSTTTVTADKIVTFGKEVLIINESPKTTAKTTVATKPGTSPQQQPTAAKDYPQTTAVSAHDHHTENTTTKFDEKQRNYLLGKKATRRITTDNGMVIVDNGAEITEAVLQKAKLAGKFAELSMSIR